MSSKPKKSASSEVESLIAKVLAHYTPAAANLQFTIELGIYRSNISAAEDNFCVQVYYVKTASMRVLARQRFGSTFIKALEAHLVEAGKHAR